MNKHYGMNLSIYKALRRPTKLVASMGKCGYEDYREVQIFWDKQVGKFGYIITDGYDWLSIVKYHSSIRSILNLCEGQFKSELKKVG